MQGPLTLATVLQQLAACPPEREINLSGVTQLDSAGLSLLLELKRRARARGVMLGFTQIPPAVKRLADHFGISGILDLKL